MEISLSIPSLNTSYESLKNINGIKFTYREIDIISCLISGKSSDKSIAAFLAIEPKTVEVHTRNIRLKINAFSRENIVCFIEEEEKFTAMRQHYIILWMQHDFENILKNILSLFGKEHGSLLILYEKKYERFIEQLKIAFEYIGVNVKLKVKELSKSLTYYTSNTDFNKVSHFVFMLTAPHFKEIFTIQEPQKEGSFIDLRGQKFLFISYEENYEEIFPIENTFIKKNNFIFFKNKDYYFIFFKLYNMLYPDHNIDRLISNFKEKYNAKFNNFSNKEIKNFVLNEKVLKSEKKFFLKFLERLRNNLHKTALLILLLLSILFFTSFSIEKYFLINKENKYQNIRSDFFLPHDNVLLNRAQLLKQIDKKLTGDKKIKAIALVGIGGAGKSTLARQYANQQNDDVVWEINAETKESLNRSLEALAYLLAKTEEDKKELRVLEEIKNPERKADRILSFTKAKLRKLLSWFLVYDNVENFTEVQKYFPMDSTSWGNGKIIVTTRNSNISNNSYIHHTITIGELTHEEKVNLFLSIINYNNSQLLPKEDKKTHKFLDNIPPFPLDISSTAHYLKTTKLPYEKYLENIRYFSEDFSNLHEELENDISGYTGSRYKIIISALTKLIEENKEFENFLLLLSLVDSQNVPRELFDFFKNNVLSEKFIYGLNKYCLVTTKNTPYETISIHRSIQKIISYYIYRQIHIKNRKEKFRHVAKVFEDYLINTAEGDNYDKIKNLIIHCQSFVNKEFISLEIKKNIEGKLGILMYRLGYYVKAKYLLKKSLSSTNIENKDSYLDIALFMQYLGNVYGYLGNLPKAEGFLEKSLCIYKNNLAKNDCRIAYILLDMGLVNYRLGQYKKAKKLFEESLKIHKKQFPEDHFRIAWVSTHLGMTYGAMGYYEKAEALFNKSFRIYKKNFGEKHIKTAWVLLHIGRIYKERGDYEKAKNLIEYALFIYKKNFSENDVSITRIITNLGSVYANLGKYENAKTFLKKSLKLQEENFGKEDILTAETLMELGKVCFLEEQLEEAEALINRSLRVFQKNNHPNSYVCLETLADIYGDKYIKMKTNKEELNLHDLKEQSLTYLTESLKVAIVHFPLESSHIKRLRERILNFNLALQERRCH